MLKQDYILRLVAQLARAVAGLVARVKSESPEAVEQDLDAVLRELSGLGFDLLDGLSLEALLAVLDAGGERDPARCLAIAELSALRAELDERAGRGEAALARRVTAATLFLEAFLAFRHEALAASEARLESLLATLADYELPAPTLLRLLRFRAAQGRFAAAEDVLFELLERGLGGVELVAEGRAFYTALLARSDDELAAGRLPRAEVREGLAALASTGLDGGGSG